MQPFLNLLLLFGITPSTGDPVPSKIPEALKAPKEGNLESWIKDKYPNITILRLPNISSFEINLGTFDPLMLANGILQRVKPEMNFSNYRNGKCNRYLLYITWRLLKLHETDKELYWHFTYSVLSTSNAYLIACLWQIEKNLYRRLNITEIKHLLKEVNLLRGNKMNTFMGVIMELRRVYIAKGASSFRPLGVPKLSWRVYLNMLLHVLVIACPIGETQHGFVPGRGTMTAWKEILTKTIKSENIFEIDLKQCFPSINLVKLRRILEQKYELPRPVSQFYESLNFNIPTLPNGIKITQDQQYTTLEAAQRYNLTDIALCVSSDFLPENIWKAGHGPQSLRRPKPTPFSHDSFVTGWSYMEEFPENIYARKMKEQLEVYYDRMMETGIDTDVLENFIHSMEVEGAGEYPRFKAIRHAVNHYKAGSYPSAASVPIDIHDAEALKFLGTIQGSPLSPYLSAIVIEEINMRLPKGVGVVKYADDMIFYGTELKGYVSTGKFEKDLSDVGLTLSKGESTTSSNMKTQKTGWVRLDGKWLKELAFLGLTYNGLLDQLRSTTRKGRTLIYNKQSLVDNIYDIEQILKVDRKVNIMQVAKYMRKAVKIINIALFNTILRTPVVVDIVAYNIAQNMIEMIKMADATNRNAQLMKLIMFMRMLFSLPRRVLWGIQIRELAKMSNKPEALNFLKQVFDEESGDIKVELADEMMEPNDSKSMYNPFNIVFHRTAPYLMKEGQEVGLYHRLRDGWQYGIRIEAIYRYDKPADRMDIRQNLSVTLEMKTEGVGELTPELFLAMVIIGLFIHPLLIVFPLLYIILNPKVKTEYKELKVHNVAPKMRMRSYPDTIRVNDSPTEIGHPTSFKYNFPLYH